MTIKMELNNIGAMELVNSVRDYKRDIHVDDMFGKECYCKEITMKHWLVESENKDHEYDVSLSGPSCTCPHWTHVLVVNENRDERICKHIRYALLYYAKKYGAKPEPTLIFVG